MNLYFFQVYYPVRHHLVQHMISAMQRLGFTPSVTIEQRKLAVDLAEVVIKWELQRIKDQLVRLWSNTQIQHKKKKKNVTVENSKLTNVFMLPDMFITYQDENVVYHAYMLKNLKCSLVKFALTCLLSCLGLAA